jgi:hypothetical protein
MTDLKSETAEQAPPTVLCDNEGHLDEMEHLPAAIARLTWPSGRFKPGTACQECLETTLDLYVLSDEMEGRRLGVVVVPADEPEIDVAKLRNGARTLGRTVVHMSRTMRAAWIEMQQNGPQAAMQWVLNALPDVDDNDPEDQWDGKESAAEWLDRTAAAEVPGA